MLGRTMLVATMLVILVVPRSSARAGDPLIAPDPHHRAGYPQAIAPWAVPSDTGHYCGYRVGGGSCCFGDPPARDEGTWGWDYWGCLWPKKIALGWYHGRKSQGGVGAYRTTGKNLDSPSTP